MSRRRLVVLASAIAILIIGLTTGAAFLSVTQTHYGREKMRQLIRRELAGAIQGKLYLGHLGGSFLTSLTIDSVEIRDPDDSLFLASGPISVEYDPRDIVDRRILLRNVLVEHPVITIRHSDKVDWNWKRVFRGGAPSGPPSRGGHGLGDFIVIYQAVVRDGSFTLRLPWHPDDTLHGARRDSAVAYNLSRPDKDIRRTAEGYIRSWHWRAANVTSRYVRLADPDSVGKYFDASDLSVLEFDPPFAVRNASGGVRINGDSLWLNFPHFDLPRSTGHAGGKIWWGSDLPIRYDIAVRGDSVSLSDIGWVYPTLPTTGGGSMDLQIRSERDLRVIDYAITNMDVRTTNSRLRGDMTFGVGGPVLAVKDMAMDAMPLDFRLIRQFNGKPFPFDWQGQITGRVRARGGPLTNFMVDSARFVFRDAHVPGAVSSGTARGELDIFDPALTAFHDFDISLDRFDLRTPRFLNPAFPALDGYVSGTARLDSSWLDIRFSQADLYHYDGPGDPSHVTGSGRVTWGTQFLTYDLDLQAAPVSMTMLARSYPQLPLRGTYHGPIVMQGTLENLELSTALTNDGGGGTLAVTGHFDLFPPGIVARATATLTDADLRVLLGNPSALSTSLGVTVRTDITGDSLPTMTGPVAVDLGRSMVDGVRIYSSRGRLRFANRRLYVDTLDLESVAGQLRARGALGLSPEETDTLSYHLIVDSLGGLRRYLGPPRVVGRGGELVDDGASGAVDSLSGALTADGALTGAIDSMAIAGVFQGDLLVWGTQQARRLAATFAFADLPDSATGTASLQLDTVLAGAVRVAHAAVDVRLLDPTHARMRVAALSATGPTVDAGLSVAFGRDTTRWMLDSLDLTADSSRWHLDRPVSIVVAGKDVTIDSLRLRNGAGGRLAMYADLPAERPVHLALTADSVPLADVGLLAQTPKPLGGVARVDWSVEGTRADPTMRLAAALTSARFGGTRLELLTARGDYARRRLDLGMTLFRGGAPALRIDGALPLDLALIPVAKRELPDSIRGNIRSDSLDFSIVQALTPALQRASGKLSLNVDVAGTLRRPRLNGALTIAGGDVFLPSVGVEWQRIGADVRFLGDSFAINRLSIATSGERQGSLSLQGGLSVADWANPRFDFSLTARNFHAMNRARVADLDLSTPGNQALRLVGSRANARLSGGIEVPRGEITIPELFNKKVLSLDDPEARSLVDTTLEANRRLLPGAQDTLIQNLELANVSIGMGDDVWLRSAEANIKLGGSVNVQRGLSDRAAGPGQLALSGDLRADRGTYRLNLGPVQRTFDIQRGSLRFFGDPDLNPELDILALYTVRPFGRQEVKQDVRVFVQIGGTLANPTLSLSVDNKEGSESDALSYLVTGEPSYGVGGQGGLTTETVISAGVSSLGSVVADRFGRGVFDVFTLQTSGLDATDRSATTQDRLRSLAGTRVGAGKQIGSRTFVSANLGLCELGQLGGGQSASSTDLASSLGGTVEYRLSRNYSISAAIEPPSLALSCGVASSTAVQRPRQVGFDLFRVWQF